MSDVPPKRTHAVVVVVTIVVVDVARGRDQRKRPKATSARYSVQPNMRSTAARVPTCAKQ